MWICLKLSSRTPMSVAVRNPVSQKELSTIAASPLRFMSFNGACFDTGAQRSVVGRKQAEAYYRYMGIPLIIKTDSPRVYNSVRNGKKVSEKPSFAIPYNHEANMIVEVMSLILTFLC